MKSGCPVLSGCGGLSRSERKLQAIHDAARTAFMEKGFEAVSMDHIAEAAGVSKRTVYNHFENKEALFAEIMVEICDTNRGHMLDGIDADLPIEEALHCLGVRFLTMLFDPKNIALYRILAAQTEKFPEIGVRFFEMGPRITVNALADYLTRQAENGVIELDGDAFEVAGSFMSSLHGKYHTESLLTDRPPPSGEAIERMVERAVRRFLHGVAVRR